MLLDLYFQNLSQMGGRARCVMTDTAKRRSSELYFSYRCCNITQTRRLSGTKLSSLSPTRGKAVVKEFPAEAAKAVGCTGRKT